jgi:hypothetical protein
VLPGFESRIECKLLFTVLALCHSLSDENLRLLMWLPRPWLFLNSLLQFSHRDKCGLLLAPETVLLPFLENFVVKGDVLDSLPLAEVEAMLNGCRPEGSGV